ncbi:MAG: acyl-CoA dehydrogenase N-terminal domain-containing protein, partial [Deltaproteobacteria bacterium]|nr:acyl-CoA dehydrogenase N-terminal domain-containing protein [Deltaproteobacteria bacterium]
MVNNLTWLTFIYQRKEIEEKMAQVIADRRDLDFVLYEQLKVDELTKL